MIKFMTWINLHRYPLTAASVLKWCTWLAKHEQLAPSTLDQKISHINFFAQLGLFPPVRELAQRRFLDGLTKLLNYTPKRSLLPPSLIVTMFNSPSSLMVDSILFQSQVGLRGGQMVKITPHHLLPTIHMVPPYKHCKVLTLLPLQHVNPDILARFLSHATAPHLPIVNLSAKQYKDYFASTIMTFGYKRTSHAARRTFATVHDFLKSPPTVLASHLIHANSKTTMKSYVLALGTTEGIVVLSHPELFKALPNQQLVSF